ncbi:MAG: HipA family kinase [bacterium]
MIQAIEFYEELRRGSSLPLIVGADDGNKYVVKLNGAGDGVLSNVVEWVSSNWGRLLQIPVLQPIFMIVDANLAEQAGDPETRALLEKSVGINLATTYLPAASSYSEKFAHGLDSFLTQRIFLFDLFLLNVDRTEMNPNMVFHDNKLWCLDYSAAMEIRNAINGHRSREYVLLKSVKQHPFYRPNLTAYGFINDLNEIHDNSVREIVDTLPAAWINALKLANHEVEARRLIAERLILKKQNGIALHNRLDLLRVLKVETPEASRLRSQENRKFFEQKYGKL